MFFEVNTTNTEFSFDCNIRPFKLSASFASPRTWLAFSSRPGSRLSITLASYRFIGIRHYALGRGWWCERTARELREADAGLALPSGGETA